MVGPMQMILIGFERVDLFRGEILEELERLGDKGLIRVIDLQFVMKDESGRIQAMEGSPLSEQELIEFGAVIGGLMGMGEGGTKGAIEGAAAGALAVAEKEYGLTWSDVQEIGADLEPGTAAALLLFEHTWATRFSEAIQDAGGRMLSQGFLTQEALLMVGAELEAVAEAHATIEAARAAEGMAILDALATVIEAQAVKEAAIEEAVDVVVAAEIIEEQAIEEAEEVVWEAEQIKALAAAEAVKALIAAEVIEEVAAQRALEALVAAELIERAALEAAASAATEAG